MLFGCGLSKTWSDFSFHKQYNHNFYFSHLEHIENLAREDNDCGLRWPSVRIMNLEEFSKILKRLSILSSQFLSWFIDYFGLLFFSVFKIIMVIC